MSEAATEQSIRCSAMKTASFGNVPHDWDVVRLDVVAKRGSGHTPDKECPEYWGGQIKWISLADSDRLDRVYIRETAQTITQAGIEHSSAVLHPKGTVVLSRDAGIGKSAVMAEEMAVSQHFIAWRCGPKLDNHFLYYWLQLRKPEFERIAAGNTIKTIGLPYFKLLEIPLPTIPEQRAIAVALSDMDALINGLDKLIAKKRAVKLAAMQQLLSGRTRGTGFCEPWQSVSLGDLATIRRGASPRPIDNPVWFDSNSQIGWVRISDLSTTGMYLYETAQKLSELGVQSSRPVARGNLIMSICATVGRPTITEIETCIHDGFVVFEGLKVDKRFLYYALRSIEPEWLRHGQTGSQMNLNTDLIRGTIIQIPCSNREQRTIAAVLVDMDSEIAALDRRRDKTKALKQGMMQQLLTGRIRLLQPEAVV